MRLFVGSKEGLFGDTLIQTPARRALRAANPEAEIVYLAKPGSLSELALRGNPHIDRFAPEGEGIVLSAWDALQYGIENHASLYEGFAAQLGVALDSKRIDLHLTEAEEKAGEALTATFDPPEWVTVKMCKETVWQVL